MKKILVFILCAMLICAVPIVASAEGEIPADIETSASEVVDSTTETEMTTTEEIVEYVKANLEEIVVIVATALGSFYAAHIRGKMNGSLGIMNNNTIAVAKNSEEAIGKALKEVKDMAMVVESYKSEVGSLLEEIRKSAEEKKCLEDTLNSVEAFLKASKMATLEMSNEVADLLLLANIPNSKKEELYARHTKAVHDLETVKEVKSNEVEES